MKTGIYLTLFILVSAFCSCEKDNDNPPGGNPPPLQTSRYNLITSHYWRNSEFYMRMIGDMNADSIPDTTYYYDFPDPCMADDKNYFQTNGYMLIDDGANVCLSTVDSLTWALATNDTEIILDSIPFYIISLTSSQLKVSTTISTLGVTIDETLTFVYP